MKHHREGAGPVDAAATPATQPSVGKTTLVEGLAVQRKEATEPPAQATATASGDRVARRKEVAGGGPSLARLFGPVTV